MASRLSSLDKFVFEISPNYCYAIHVTGNAPELRRMPLLCLPAATTNGTGSVVVKTELPPGASQSSFSCVSGSTWSGNIDLSSLPTGQTATLSATLNLGGQSLPLLKNTSKTP